MYVKITVETEGRSETFEVDIPERGFTRRYEKLVEAIRSQAELEESLGRLREFKF